MKTKQFGTLKGLTVNCAVFESYAEADKSAGRENAMLDCGNDNAYYRGGPASDARDYICELLEEETGIARKTRDSGKKNEAGEPILVVDEAEGAYAERVCAAKGWEDLKFLQPKIDAWAATAGGTEDAPEPLSVSLKERERKAPKAKKLAKEYADAAAQVLDADKVEAFRNKVGTLDVKFADMVVVPEGSTDEEVLAARNKNILAIGFAIKAFQAAKAKNELAALVG